MGDLREAVEKVEARDRRINDLNRQILQLNEALREQVRWGRQPILSCVDIRLITIAVQSTQVG